VPEEARQLAELIQTREVASRELIRRREQRDLETARAIAVVSFEHGWDLVVARWCGIDEVELLRELDYGEQWTVRGRWQL